MDFIIKIRELHIKTTIALKWVIYYPVHIIHNIEPIRAMRQVTIIPLIICHPTDSSSVSSIHANDSPPIIIDVIKIFTGTDNIISSF